jgi:Protein of unknown function (DUF2971)
MCTAHQRRHVGDDGCGDTLACGLGLIRRVARVDWKGGVQCRPCELVDRMLQTMRWSNMADQANDSESGRLHSESEQASHKNIPTPPRLYKYLKYYAPDETDWTKRIFTDNAIYFAAPMNFNDPFDSVTRFTYPNSKAKRERFIREWVRRSLPHIPEAVADQQVKGTIAIGDDIAHMEKICEELTYQMQQSNAVFCMTEKNDNILMWAHYADQHTGFCLEFGTDTPLFSRVRPVRYAKNLPKQDLVEFFTVDVRQLPLYLVTKANDWEYEKEWRLADPGSGPGPQEYPAESLTGVIFGCRMNEKNRKQIQEWCREREQPPKLFEAKEKRTEYGLDIIPIS